MSQSTLRLAFAGTPELAAKVLDGIISADQHRVEVVFTQPDRPAGRGRKLKQSEVKICAIEHGIPVLQPEKAVDLKPEHLNNCDLMLVVAYGLLIKPSVLSTPEFGCINIHTSLLPRWRGAAPIQRAIEAGDKQTGITLMQMDEGLDTGAILEQVTCQIGTSETGGQLHDRLAEIAAENINRQLTQIANRKLVPVKQDESKATYAGKISKQEAKINWSKSAADLDRKVRAFNPFPVAHTRINDIDIRVWETEIKKETENLTPGSILNNKSSLDIVTGDGVLAIKKLQLPGKRIMAAKDFFNGHPDFFNTRLVAV